LSKVDPGHAHNIKGLNVIFAFSAIGLLLATVGLIWADYSREWKNWQRRFQALDLQTTRSKLQQAQQAVDQNQIQELQAKLKEAEEALGSQQSALAEALDKEKKLSDALYLADIRARELKSVYDSRRYYFEEDLQHHPEKAERERPAFDKLEKDFFEAQAEFRRLDFEHLEARGKVREIRARETEIQGEIRKLNEQVALIQRKLGSIRPSFANFFRNLPVVDFIDPSIKIKQVMVSNVTEELNFTQVPRVDRCMTCHLGIDNPDFADAPQPFRTHPNLDLFVKLESPHSMERFGCTGCHSGRGRATTFTRVVHTPRDEAQKKEWEEKYGWHEDHYWDSPMFPVGTTESGCLKCHKNVVWIPEADLFNRGRDLYERAGCWGCHNTQGFENRRKVGPDLLHVASKTTPEWAARWVRDPKSFKTSTRMPRFWNLDNNPDSSVGARNDTEVASIVAYVFDKSEPLTYAAVVPPGSAVAGKELVESVGCLGCHITDDAEAATAHPRRRHGPSLAGLGSKVNREFLFHWLKNPKHYWAGTFMPDLRLTDREAADVTAYLMSFKSPEFESLPVPAADPGALDEVVLEFLRAGLPDQMASEKLASMSEQDKKLYAGEKLIQRYGCFGCHDIKGFENAQKIGVDLSDWGSKMVTRLDFGFVEIEHNRRAWLEQKLAAPRSYDNGKIKTPPEKLRMPYFGFSEEEIDDIARNVLGQVREEMPREGVKNLTAEEELANRGRLIVHQYNCQGCHLIEGEGGAIYETIEDPGLRPPNLNTQGAKVKADWLFAFLKEPSTIRPWFKARMPTFGLGDDHANMLVRYFMALDKTHPFETLDPPLDRLKLASGEILLNRLQCLKCHVLEAMGTLDASQLAPNFRLARERLREDWIVRWLLDPQTIMPGTQMPQFWPFDDAGKPITVIPDVLDGDPMRQMEAVAAYILEIGKGGSRGAAAGGQDTSPSGTPFEHLMPRP
jgi:cytochrome c2